MSPEKEAALIDALYKVPLDLLQRVTAERLAQRKALAATRSRTFRPRHERVHAIITAAAEIFGVKSDEIYSLIRTRDVANARLAAIGVANVAINLSARDLAAAFDRSENGTIGFAIKRVALLLDTDPAFARRYSLLCERVFSVC